MAKSEKYVLRHAKNRYSKGKATEKDIELIKKYEPELLDETIEVEKEEIRREPPKNRDFKEVKNSDNYAKKDTKSFIEDVNEFTTNEFKGSAFTTIEPDGNTIESNSFINSDNYAKAADEPKAETKYLNGAMLLFLIDLIAPELFAFLARKFLKKDIKGSDLKSYEDLQALEELADKVAEDIQTDNMSPAQMLTIGCLLIYVPKILEK